MRSEQPAPPAGAASVFGPDVIRQALLSVAFKPGEGWRSDGGRFGWILDTRELTLDSRYLPLVGQMLWSLARRYSPDLVAGTGIAGGPLVASVLMAAGAEGAKVAGAIVREQRKPHGRRRLVEGPPLPPGSRVVLLDDLASSGQTLLRIRENLLAAGFEVRAAVLLVDYERGARSALARVDVTLDACYSLSELGIGRSSSGVQRSFSTAWHYSSESGEPPGTPPSSPVINDDRVVFGTDTGDLVALDRGGALLWRRRLADPSTAPSLHSTPRICADAIFIGADDGYLYRADLGSGELAWRLRCGTGVRSSPAVDAASNVVVVGARDEGERGTVVAASLNGGLRWQQQRDAHVDASPGIEATTGTVVAGDDAGLVVGYDVTSGAERWRWRCGGAVKGGFAFHRGHGFCFGSFDGVVQMSSLADGRPIWSRRVSDRLNCTPLIQGRSVILGGTSHLVCLDAEDGEVLWWRAIGGSVRSGGALLDQRRVAFGCADGSVLVLDIRNGHVLAKADVDPIRSIAADAGLIVARCSEGDVYGLRPPAAPRVNDSQGSGDDVCGSLQSDSAWDASVALVDHS